ncbi:MAG: hypothetical protein ACK523_14970, partial [Pirellulaceae bacterium]
MVFDRLIDGCDLGFNHRDTLFSGCRPLIAVMGLLFRFGDFRMKSSDFALMFRRHAISLFQQGTSIQHLASSNDEPRAVLERVESQRPIRIDSFARSGYETQASAPKMAQIERRVERVDKPCGAQEKSD